MVLARRGRRRRGESGSGRLGGLGENLRLAGFVAAQAGRAGGRRVAALVRAPIAATGRTPEKLLIAPQDLRTTDPTRAGEIYAGTFTLAGKAVEVRGASPFLVEPPSRDWAAALHGFGWLRHLRAADTSLARANARSLVDEWIAARRGRDAVAASPAVLARRLISWLCHSPLILDGADRAFYRRFLKSLARQTRQLGGSAGGAPEGASRLLAQAALAYAGLCLAGETRLLKTAAKALGDEIERQILPDGGHVSRNPATLVDLLLDLLPLRQAFSARNVQPPQALITAIDRMTPMLRFFRHGDGEFAQFNGAGPTPTDLVATILAYDDVRGLPVEDAPHSGYQRFSAGEALVIMDAGAPPPFALSSEAHAGCLSFEFSSGIERIVVNCGAPRFGRADWEAAARATAAHSTATIGDQSSCRFASDRLRRFVGARILSGPSAVEAKRVRDDRGVTVTASHDGYAKRFGVIHERAVTLSPDGLRLSGADVFRAAEGRAIEGDPRVALRFHLHPSVRASARQDGQGVVLALPGGTGWAFSSPGFPVTLEEGISLASAHGPRRSEQIVIHATVRGAPEIAWAFERLPGEAAPRRRMPVAAEFDPLPL
ncbi:MAG: heparinase [Ancylobacter novellus]|uniref:Heparinase n=1 Tax=Ancylobacter novellus TaxID=921 RepID=A0A2W5K7D6_ANCNO|nr:MAG: heparinase [Ancylobacter novellus]